MEILKALYRQADILILDEPTGVLTPDEADHLFRILHGLQDQGKTIILITHKLREIMEVTDNVSVMRRGEMAATVKTAETSPEQLAELMVGRKVLLDVEKKPATPGERGARGREPARRGRTQGRTAEGHQLRHPRRRNPGHRRASRATASPNCWKRLGGMQPRHRHSHAERRGAAPDGRQVRRPDAAARAGIAHVPEDRQHEA